MERGESPFFIMTIITNYSSLKQNIRDYHKRGDGQSKYETFIALCENDFINAIDSGGSVFSLRVKEMQETILANGSTFSRYLDLPERYLSFNDLRISINDRFHSMTFKNQANMKFSDHSGIPCFYTISQERIEFDKIPDKEYEFRLEIYRAPEPLSDAFPVNKILESYPNVYLFGCLYHAFMWSMQYDLAEYWKGRFVAVIAAANRSSKKGRYGPRAAMITPGVIH